MSNKRYKVVSCFLELEGKILLLKRAKSDLQYGLWGIPGGKVESDETEKEGLSRELEEELGLQISPEAFEMLAAEIPLMNNCDGEYQLYTYYLKLNEQPVISLNPKEHSDLIWVTVDNFKNYPLLFCQGTAFDLSKDKLLEKINYYTEVTV